MTMGEIAEIRAQEELLRLKRFRLEGKYGVCSTCGKENMYANWGDDEPLLCCKCLEAKKARKVREKHAGLIGMTVSDIVADDGELAGLVLKAADRQDVKLVIEKDWDGEGRLEIAKPINTVHA